MRRRFRWFLSGCFVMGVRCCRCLLLRHRLRVKGIRGVCSGRRRHGVGCGQLLVCTRILFGGIGGISIHS